MTQLIYVVGDRVRIRHPALRTSNTAGTVTTVFHSATDYYDVKFDVAPGLRVCYAGDMEHSPDEEPPFWTDDGGTSHPAPAMRDLPPLLQLGIKRMVRRIVDSSQATHQDAEEAVNIILCVLFPHLSNDAIDRYPYERKRHFVMGWLSLQDTPRVIAA